ncbi:MAG: threonine--tRNA ligase, partial [Planctomycetota bacterium]
MKVTFYNNMIELPARSTLAQLAQKESKKTKDLVVAGKINGHPVDFDTVIPDGAAVEFITASMPEGLDILRHSLSHIMAEAVMKLYPDTKLAIGPSIADGFYYDFDAPQTFADGDLGKISAEIEKSIKEKKTFRRMELSRTEAIKIMTEQKQPYKVELLNEIQDTTVTFYQHGNFIDLCRGPHIPHTGLAGSYKLLRATGAYWRGNEHNKMLQRIYGTAFATRQELDAHLKHLEEIKKRDHRRLGKDLDLFSIQEEAGPGLIYWHPKGALIRKVIEDFWRNEHLKNNYDLIYSPHIARVGLWKTSGHWEFYRENMYSPIDIEGMEYIIKPMNCPGHILIYRSKIRSYRDLPLRWAELGTVYRYERSGVMHGLMRVRGFTQDDAHIFCRPDQLNDEVSGVIKFGTQLLCAFGFSDFKIRLSTRPIKYVGTVENWDKATLALKQAIESIGLPYEIAEGEAVFYGPKADIDIKDSLGRAWQCFTVQVDFNLPERFDIVYTAQDGSQQRPIMIHRALLGSLERFFGVLIEHYGGAFPLWLAPVQVLVLPVL